MKIAIFTNTYLPINTGVVVAIETFRKGQMDLGQDMYVFAPHYSKGKREKNIYRYKSIDFKDFNAINSLFVPFLSARIPKIVDRIKPDIIHSQHPWILGESARFFAKKLGIPLVFTYHTMHEQYTHYIPFSQPVLKHLAKAMAVNYANSCDCVIAPTESVRKYLWGIGVNSRIEVVPTGVNLDAYKKLDGSKIRKKYGVLKNEKLLLCVARLGQEKNISFLIKALKELSKRRPDIKLMLVGSGTEEDKLINQINKLGLEGKVIMTGAVKPSNIPDFYAAADLFVFASTSETQGIVFLEAKAAGVPIVAVRATGTKDMVVDNKDGIMTPLKIEDFNKACSSLLNDPILYKEFSEYGKMDVKKYTVKATSKKLLSIYKSLVKK